MEGTPGSGSRGGWSRRRRRLLLAESTPRPSRTVGNCLRRAGFAVSEAEDGPQALDHVLRHDVDVIVLDIMRPTLDGFEVCHELRRRRVGTPILILTTRDRLADKVAGLRHGFDDYLTKPFELDELLARLEALLRRSRIPAVKASQAPILRGLTVDFRRNEVLRDGQRRSLSNKEAGLFRHLLHNAGRTVSRAELLEEVWGYHQDVTSRTVDVHMVSLRRKVERDPRQPRRLLTVHGQGYKLVPDEF